MRLPFAIACGIVGAAFIFFGILPLARGIKSAWLFIIIGGLLIVSIPASVALGNMLPRFYRAVSRALLIIFAAGICTIIAASIQMLSKSHVEAAPKNSVVITLGAALSRVDHTNPSLVLARRLDKTLEYLEANPGSVCVVSGGQGELELISEGESMKRYLVRRGIAPERVYAETESTDTEQNIELSKRLLEREGLMGESDGNVVIVTDGFHEYRAHYFAKREGLTPYSYPCSTPWWVLPMYWMRETLGVVLETWLKI